MRKGSVTAVVPTAPAPTAPPERWWEACSPNMATEELNSGAGQPTKYPSNGKHVLNAVKNGKANGVLHNGLKNGHIPVSICLAVCVGPKCQEG